MSNDVNTRLLEEALELCEYWTGTLYEKLMQQAIDEQDYDQLDKWVREASNARFDKEFNPLEYDDGE